MKEAELKEKFEAVYSLSIRRGEDSSVVWDWVMVQLTDAKKEHLSDMKEIQEAAQKAYVETGLRVSAVLIENETLKKQIESLNTKEK